MRKIRKVSLSMREIFLIIVLIIPSFFLFYFLSTRSTSQQTRNTKDLPVSGKVAIPKHSTFLGVSMYDQNYESLLSLEEKLDKHFSIVGVYQSWGGKNNKFNISWAENIAYHGSVPMITWEPWVPVAGYDRSVDKVDQKKYHLIYITRGDFDDYLTNYARAVRQYGKKIMIRFAHEMNGNWYSWGSAFNTPDEYIAAWRHVHDIFEQEGATNVTWIWSPNEVYNDKNIPYSDEAIQFYPGDNYVDWVGFSSFNWAGKYKQNVWRDPESLYTPTVTLLSQIKKPLMISETASADLYNPQMKARWIRELARYIKNNPEIKGVIWFNIDDNGIDWKIDSTPFSLIAFKESFDQYFIQQVKN